MLEYMFKAILITSIMGTASALFFTIIKPITKKCFSASWNYYIWLIVLITMVVPFRFVLPEIDRTTSKQEEAIHGKVNYIENNPVLDFVINDNLVQESTQNNILENKIEAAKAFPVDKMSLLALIWLFGAVSIFLLRILGYFVFILKVKCNSKEITCPNIQKFTHRKVIIRQSDKIISPLMLGVIKPTLILPQSAMTDEQLNNVLAHEMTHFKRNDILYKWFACIVKCIHWFNPAIYYVARQINIECEISCDFAVLKGMSKEQEASYIDTILTLITAKSKPITNMTTAMASDKKLLKRRFTMIKNRANVSKKAIIISVIIALVILCGVVFASGFLNGKFINKYENELVLVNTDPRQGDDFNFLFVGMDKQNRADTIMLLSREGENLTCVSFPRYTEFVVDGKRASATEILNGEYGNQRIIDAVKSALSLPITYFVKVDLTAVETLIDSVGGIEIDVPMDMEYDDPEQNLHIKLKQGRHTLSGAEACGLLQFRRSNDGSGYGEQERIEIGQRVIKEFITQKLYKEFANNAPEIFKELAQNIETNYSASNLVKDIRMLDDINTEITFKTFSGASITDDNGAISENGENTGLDEKKTKKNTYKEKTNIKKNIVSIVMPCDGTISNGFGKRVHPITNETREHNGIDIKAPEGTDVVSSISGTVTDVGYDAEKGNYIVVEHDNLKTTYSQLSATNVKKGDNINANQTIGAVGSTGNATGAHLHFEVMVDGEYVDPKSLMKE